MRLTSFSKIFNQKTLVGIDIQTDGVQLVQLSHSKQGRELKKTAHLALGSDIFMEGKIHNWEKLTAQLFEWVRELDLVGADTAAALPAQMVKLLRLKKKVLNEAMLRSQLELELPGLGQSVAIDHCAFEKADTLVVIAKQDYLNNYITCLQEAGFNLKIVDMDLFALQRAFGEKLYKQKETGLLWQQRTRFTLLWHDEHQLVQQVQWAATYGESAISELAYYLNQNNIHQLFFCGSTYYCELFKKAQNLAFSLNYFSPSFKSSSINMPDYLLALGLAMREVPKW